MLTREEIEEFKRIYDDEFGEKLSDHEAHDRAVEVVALFELILEIPPEHTGENCQK